MGGIGSEVSDTGDWEGEFETVESVEVAEYTDADEYGMGGILYTMLRMFIRSA